MRVALISIGIVFLLFSCRKNKFEGCENYQKFIGVWQEEDGEANSSYEFKKNGKIIFKQGIDRGYSVKIDRFILVKIDPINGWKRYAVEYKNSIYYHLSYSISPAHDTLWAAGALLDDESVQQQTKQFYTKRQ